MMGSVPDAESGSQTLDIWDRGDSRLQLGNRVTDWHHCCVTGNIMDLDIPCTEFILTATEIQFQFRPERKTE